MVILEEVEIYNSSLSIHRSCLEGKCALWTHSPISTCEKGHKQGVAITIVLKLSSNSVDIAPRFLTPQLPIVSQLIALLLNPA